MPCRAGTFNRATCRIGARRSSAAWREINTLPSQMGASFAREGCTNEERGVIREIASLHCRLLQPLPRMSAAVAISTLLAIANGGAYAGALDMSRPDRPIAARQHHARVAREGCSQKSRTVWHQRHAACRRLYASPPSALPYDRPGSYVLHGPHF